MITRFQVTGVDDSGPVQRVSGRGMAGESFDGPFALTRIQGHGSSAVPPVGAVGLAVFPFGDRRRGYVLGLESGAARPRDLPAGAHVIYGPDGRAIRLLASGIRFEGGVGGAVTISADHVVIEGQTVTIRSGDIRLGEGASAAVMTTAGASSNVKALA